MEHWFLSFVPMPSLAQKTFRVETVSLAAYR
ncbi:DNA protecting protein DprA, partial [Vibrio parahaemolyticus V-223/04]